VLVSATGHQMHRIHFVAVTDQGAVPGWPRDETAIYLNHDQGKGPALGRQDLPYAMAVAFKGKVVIVEQYLHGGLSPA